MPYLKEIAVRDEAGLPAEFPFTLPVIESLETLVFSTPVTFFVGENGSGKSTLIESLAVGMNCPTMGAMDVKRDPMLEDARRLAAELRFVRQRSPKRKLFFRAEDAIGYTRRLLEDMSELKELESHYDETLSGYGRQLAMGAARGQHQALSGRYGDNPDARSHGEWFLAMLESRVMPGGLYLLDEPETPLSPIHQLTLLSFVRQMVEEDCQFIIATHSPILMALPDARILAFDQRIEEVAWDEVEHVSLTRSFLNDPAGFLRHL